MAFISKSAPGVLNRTRKKPAICTVRARVSDNGTRFSRREFSYLLQAAAASAAFLNGPKRAVAISGLKMFPLTEPLTNSYYMMRAAESVSDAKGIAKSNPIEMVCICKIYLWMAKTDIM